MNTTKKPNELAQINALVEQMRLVRTNTATNTADIRGAHQLACGDTVISKLLERRCFTLLQQAIALGEAVNQLCEDIDDAP